MLTYCWSLPTEGDQAILRIHSSSGWFGVKEFHYRDRQIFRRGLFSGIDCPFHDPKTGAPVHLQMKQVGAGPSFKPVLTIDGAEQTETRGTPPPRVPVRPPSLAVVTGITYLLMLMAVVMLQPIAKILDAVYLRMDNRKLVMQLVEPDDAAQPTTQAATLRVRSEQLPPARVGEPYLATISAEGGVPPYVFERVRKRWPKTLKLDPDSGKITGKLTRWFDLSGTVKVTDAAGTDADGVFAIVVQSDAPRDPSLPTILSTSLPQAVVGEEYSFQLEVRDGKPPYSWQTLESDLPKGLELDKETGAITGKAETPIDRVVAFRVVDDFYHASQDMYPWAVPILITAVCLLGYWNMRGWGVVLLGIAILAEFAARSLGLVPVSTTAMIIQGALLLIGLMHWPAME